MKKIYVSPLMEAVRTEAECLVCLSKEILGTYDSDRMVIAEKELEEDLEVVDDFDGLW